MAFKLFDFCLHNQETADATNKRVDNKQFLIEMFAMNQKGETASILVEGFKPFFYVKVGDNWSLPSKDRFLQHIKEDLKREEITKRFEKFGSWKNKSKNQFIQDEIEKYRANPDDNRSYYEDSIVGCKLVRKKKLFGFDDGKTYKFMKLSFKNIVSLNKVKNLWYKGAWGKDRRLQKKIISGIKTELYEAKLPPLLRFFHINKISPSGWICMKKYERCSYKRTYCDYEFVVKKEDICALEMEAQIPLRIVCFDIEASSSHGDFPLASKHYEKLAMDILDVWDEYEDCDNDTFRDIILIAFKHLEEDEDNMVHEVFPRRRISKEDLQNRIKAIIKKNIVDYLNSDASRSDKYDRLCVLLGGEGEKKGMLPELEGDKVTFIGSSFRRITEEDPYLNHCVVLNTCDNIDNSVVATCKTEKEVLMSWARLLQKERPDIIVGYNIFGFDWKFLLERAKNLGIYEIFRKLSKIKNFTCKHVRKTIRIASGEHNLEYLETPGMIQFDLYNYFRRQFNFESYKLDFVVSKLIGDRVSQISHERGMTRIESSNLMGLKRGNYIRLEEIGHCVDSYMGGSKLKVCELGDGCFYIENIHNPNMKKTVRWCLGKDDVSPHDIFRLSNGDSSDRMIVGKYCLMDCQVLHSLLKKLKILTGFVETSNICSVPISFIIFRGQSIKLFSLISRKCRELGVVIPVLERKWNQDSYEGAICLPPKTNLYTTPVACVDYGSLYPSSMISENLSHDSKVWTKSYDLEGTLIKETGEKNMDGSYKYDNLPNYTYVDITFDRFRWSSKTVGGPKSVKTKVGVKICRFAQFPNNRKAILPSILEELLRARKSTRAMAKYKTVKTDEDSYTGLISKNNGKIKIKQVSGEEITIPEISVTSIKDTYNDFEKVVFDKRQLGYKVAANSVYGQCGATTSDFYEPDIAASTTATGRLLLIFAKKGIETVYKNRTCDTKYGKVIVNAIIIYGDTDSCFFVFNITDLDGNRIRGKKELEITIELAQEAGTLISKMLKKPHDLEYEKTFMPWCLLSKKRYVGMQYEFDPNKCKRKSMGIVLKRRDNAEIVKEVYGGVIDILMKNQDVIEAVRFVKERLKKLAEGGYPIEKLKITKSIRGFYKNPKQIAHKVLADRMGKRDPGNKPSSGTRIPFAYILKKGAKLQGEKIETPEFIKKNGLKLDYGFYITNQIMKPLLQVFALEDVMCKIPGINRLRLKGLKRKIKRLKETTPVDKFLKKAETLKTKIIKEVIFDDILRDIRNKSNGAQNITDFFQLKNSNGL